MQWCLASFLVVFLTERANMQLVDAGFALSAAGFRRGEGLSPWIDQRRGREPEAAPTGGGAQRGAATRATRKPTS